MTESYDYPAPSERMLGVLMAGLTCGTGWVAWRLGRFVWQWSVRRPVSAVVTVIVIAVAVRLGIVATAGFATGLVGSLALAMVVCRRCWPGEWARFVSAPRRRYLLRRMYRLHWVDLMTGHGLGVNRGDRVVIPGKGKVRCGSYGDRIEVRPVLGQSIVHFERVCDALAMGLGALSCRAAVARPGVVRLDVQWSDPLVPVTPALPVPATVNLAALPVGVREDGTAWCVSLVDGNHTLIAGVTKAGKSSVVQSLLRALAPAVAAGTVQLRGIDPKCMEFTLARAMFARLATTGDGLEAMVTLLEDAVIDMQARADRYAGRVRQHTPTIAEPFVVVLIDEMAFLTAYALDSKLRNRANQALAILCTQGRAVGFGVIGCLQDPRKDVVAMRNLFPVKVGLRLDEKPQVDMVLGDGARDAGARCDEIPDWLPGVGYVKADGVREPLRVRAAYVTDLDVVELAASYPAPASGEDSGLRVVA